MPASLCADTQTPGRAARTIGLMQTRWEHFEHGADIGVRGWGASKAEAFEQAALAMMAVITAPDAVQARDTIEIDCEAPDDEMLLVDWLNALVYEMAVRHMVFGRFHVQLNHHHLVAQALGEATSVPRHQPAVEVKGATFTTLSVVQVDGGWLAQTVVDV